MSHLKKGDPFDLRIALISIDNAVEMIIKNFFSLNKRNFGISYKEFTDSIRKFPVMLDLLQNHVSDKISTDELDKIEFFHNIRNNIYHQGTGITVSKQIVSKYAILSKDLIARLFEVDIDLELDELSLNFNNFLEIWRELEMNLRNFLLTENLAPQAEKPYRLSNIISILIGEDKLDIDFGTELVELLRFRNKAVHGISNVSSDDLDIKLQDLKRLNEKLKAFMNK